MVSIQISFLWKKKTPRNLILGVIAKRRKRDLNPRAAERPTPLAGAPLQPLEYFSMPESLYQCSVKVIRVQTTNAKFIIQTRACFVNVLPKFLPWYSHKRRLKTSKSSFFPIFTDSCLIEVIALSVYHYNCRKVVYC